MFCLARNNPAVGSFEYVVVLVSIVTGLGVTRLLTGISDAIQVANRSRGYWVHTLWMFNLFFTLTLYWWVLYRWRTAPQWNFFLFLWVNISPILCYLASGVLCPGDLEKTGSPDWRDYYYKNRRSFFLIIAIAWPLDVIDTLLKGSAHFRAQGPAYLPVIALWTFGSLIAALTRSEKYHAIWAIVFPVSEVGFAAASVLLLG